jgi:hypothetical protein
VALIYTGAAWRNTPLGQPRRQDFTLGFHLTTQTESESSGTCGQRVSVRLLVHIDTLQII